MAKARGLLAKGTNRLKKVKDRLAKPNLRQVIFILKYFTSVLSFSWSFPCLEEETEPPVLERLLSISSSSGSSTPPKLSPKALTFEAPAPAADETPAPAAEEAAAPAVKTSSESHKKKFRKQQPPVPRKRWGFHRRKTTQHIIFGIPEKKRRLNPPTERSDSSDDSSPESGLVRLLNSFRKLPS